MGQLPVRARHRHGSGLVGRLPAGRSRGRHLRGGVQRGPGRVLPARRIDHDRLDDHRLGRGRRRDPARVAHQPRLAGARDRAHVVSGAGARPAGGRRRPSGVPEPVRPDRVRRRDRCAARRRAGRARTTRSGSGRRTWRRSRSTADGVIQYETDRARFLGRGRSVALGGVGRSTDVRCRTPSEPCSTRSSACAAESSIEPGETVHAIFATVGRRVA